MIMTHLSDLHKSMTQSTVDLQRFTVRTGAVEFECIFSVRENPFILALTSRTDEPEFFKFEGDRNYKIDTFLGDGYRRLLRVLRIDGRSGQALSTNGFFAQLNEAIPTAAERTNVPTSEEVIRLRQDLEDRERPYFDRWERRGRGPTQKNRQKTLMILDPDALAFSVRENVSSIWSASPTNASWR